MTISQCSHLYNGKVFPAVLVGKERGICEAWKVASILVLAFLLFSDTLGNS